MYIWVWLCLCYQVCASNFYLQKYRGAEGSNFGYSVELANTSFQPELLVGAPGLNNNTGAVYNCPVKENEKCKRLELKEKLTFSASGTTSRKEGQWLGASISSFNDTTVICAPRWTRNIQQYIFMNGLCYWLKNGKETQLWPLGLINNQGYTDKKTDKKYYYYAYGQMGLSVHVAKTGFYVGAPGLLNWKGSIITYKELQPQIPNPLSLQELDFFSYLGYSIASGKVLVVSGAPRGGFLRGQVMLYRDGNLETTFKGLQLGEYFGASVAVGDLNGDDEDDVIVGAPMYSNNYVEAGRVHLFLSDGNGGYTSKILEGTSSRGRFGTALSIIQDVDGDGLDDLLITAPFQEGVGFVYLYPGDRMEGLRNKPLYQLSGKTPGVRGLGFSVSRSIDVDGNGIPDIAVGTYGSHMVLLIRHRPIIRVSTKLIANVTTLPLDTKPRFLNITFCLTYTGKNCLQNLNFASYISADPIHKRLDSGRENFQLNCTIGIPCCKSLMPEVISGERTTRLYTPLVFSSSHELISCEPHPRCPTEDRGDWTGKTELLIPFETGCKHSICQSELSLKANWSESSLIIGEKTVVELKFNISNMGDPAFLCEMAIQLVSPGKLRFANLPERCRMPAYDQRVMLCHLGNPLYQGNLSLTVRLDVPQIQLKDGSLIVRANVTSNGKEKNLEDNKLETVLSLETSIDLDFNSISEPEQISLDDEEEEEITVIHQVEFTSRGPTTVSVDQLSVELFVPTSLPNIGTLVHVSGLPLVTIFGRVFPLECQLNGTTDSMPNLPDHGFPEERITQIQCPCERFSCDLAQIGSGDPLLNLVVRLNMTVDLKLAKTSLADLLLLRSAMITSWDVNSGVTATSSTVFLGAIAPASALRWIIIGCAVGVVLLAITTVILYKIGFFKRQDAYNLAKAKAEAIEVEDLVEEDSKHADEQL